MKNKTNKKKFNKKKLLTFGMLSIFALALVSAIGYYALFSATFNVSPSIVTGGKLTQTLEDTYGGETIFGNEFTLQNNAPSKRILNISDNSNEDIDVSYIGKLELTKKNVDFSLDVWEIPQGAEKVEIEYKIIGNEFTAEVTNNSKEGYKLIYYADNVDRFNNVSKAINVEDINENLPYTDDENAEGGENDYCVTEEYPTCHGAKIWYVPLSAVSEEGVIDWTQADDFFFESKLIQYNQEGEIIIYPTENLGFTPMYELSDYAEGGYTIETTIA